MRKMSQKPFCAEQFTATQWDSARDKATWANAMAAWVARGFPVNGWRRGLYDPLHVHLYGHIAHYNQQGFYAEWFGDVHCQLRWLQFAASGGAFVGGVGDPAFTWSDVELAWSTWVRESGLIDHYRQLCSLDIETQERTLLAQLQRKYASESCDQVNANLLSDHTGLPESAQPEIPGPPPHRPSHAGKERMEPQKPRYVQFSLL